MNLKKIIKEEIDDFGWVEDIPPIVSFSDLRRGDKVMVMDATDYYFDSLAACGGPDEIVRVNQVYTIDDITKDKRHAQDCGACEQYDFNCREIVRTVSFDNWWWNEDMVMLTLVERSSMNESEFDWAENTHKIITNFDDINVGDVLYIRHIRNGKWERYVVGGITNVWDEESSDETRGLIDTSSAHELTEPYILNLIDKGNIFTYKPEEFITESEFDWAGDGPDFKVGDKFNVKGTSFIYTIIEIDDGRYTFDLKPVPRHVTPYSVYRITWDYDLIMSQIDSGNWVPVLKESENPFDWAKDVGNPFYIEYDYNFVVNFCQSGMLYNDGVKEKIRKLFGERIYEGIYDNPHIDEVGGNIVLYFNYEGGGYYIDPDDYYDWLWDECGDYEGIRDGIEITPDEFLNLQFTNNPSILE